MLSDPHSPMGAHGIGEFGITEWERLSRTLSSTHAGTDSYAANHAGQADGLTPGDFTDDRRKPSAVDLPGIFARFQACRHLRLRKRRSPEQCDTAPRRPPSGIETRGDEAPSGV